MTRGKLGLLGSMLARAEPQVMRIACLYALLDQSTSVCGEHLAAALALWDYAEASARFIFGDSLADPHAEKLIAALRESPAGLTRTAITTDVFNGHLKKDVLTPLLSELLGHGLIHRCTRDTGRSGPKTEIWRYGRDYVATPIIAPALAI